MDSNAVTPIAGINCARMDLAEHHKIDRGQRQQNVSCADQVRDRNKEKKNRRRPEDEDGFAGILRC